MTTSEKAKTIIKYYEGCRLRPYRCPASLWTVGYGHVLYPDQKKLKLDSRNKYELRPQDNREWTQAEVDQLFLRDISIVESGVARLCPAAAYRQGFMDALVSFAFNLGLGALQRSTLRMKLNRGEIAKAANEFLKWNKVNGVVLAGLLKRRMVERQLLLSTPKEG